MDEVQAGDEASPVRETALRVRVVDAMHVPDFGRIAAGAFGLKEETAEFVALLAGCRLLFTATGEAIPGDPQHSYRNILRYGFEPATLRENYVPSPRR